MKFDLSQFKKTGETETHATFQHPHGHQIHIAKAGVTPDLRKQIAAVPMHLAEGTPDGPIEAEPIQQDPMQVEAIPQGVTAPAGGQPSIQDINYSSLPQTAPNVSANAEIGAAGQPNPAMTPETNVATLQGIFNKQGQALDKINSGLQGATGQAEAATNKYLGQAQIADQLHQQNLSHISEDLGKDRDAYLNAKIDPRHVWNSKGGLQKASTMVGLILGGIGGAFTHQENPALKVLNSQIEQDIESQRMELGKKHTLYSMNLQKYQNENAAYIATKLQMQNSFAAQMQMAGMKMNSAQAQGHNALTQVEIQKQMYPLAIQLSQYATKRQMLGGGVPTGGYQTEMLPEGDRERTVNISGPTGESRQFLARTKEDANKFNEAEQETNSLLDKIKQAKNFVSQKGWSPGYLGVFDSPDSVESRGIMEDIQSSIGHLEGLNRLSHEDTQIFRGMNTNPGRFNSAAANTILDHLAQTAINKQKLAHKSYLSNPANTSSFKAKQ